ncbi:MAG: hypothetical protein WC365_00905 [Candidatus Babeliales bacterium]|jgi:hypothetical protein
MEEIKVTIGIEKELLWRIEEIAGELKKLNSSKPVATELITSISTVSDTETIAALIVEKLKLAGFAF